MRINAQAVVDVLNELPPERVEEVYDFAIFLKGRMQQQIDESDEWSQEDQLDAAAASLRYADVLENTDEQ